jgi:hypothetical protein
MNSENLLKLTGPEWQVKTISPASQTKQAGCASGCWVTPALVADGLKIAGQFLVNLTNLLAK